MFFAKIPGVGQDFQEILPCGGPPILSFIAFSLSSDLKIALGGYYIYPPPTSPPLCLSMHVLMGKSKNQKQTPSGKSFPSFQQWTVCRGTVKSAGTSYTNSSTIF
jgi:hypothetical protein